MNNRIDLNDKLKDLLGSNNVYYQPPESLKMLYPCIRYSKSDIISSYANNSRYLGHDKYELVIIDKKPDNAVIKKLLELPMTSFDRHYVSDNLNHDIITIYI